MEIRAKAKYLKIAPQKARLIISNFKNKKAVEADQILKQMPQKTSQILSKLLQSAMANAENNYSIKKDDLEIIQIIVEEGPSYKRIKPRARGGRDIVKKRTSHLTIILSSPESERVKKEPTKEISKEKIKEKPKSKVKKAKVKEVKPKKQEKEVSEEPKELSAEELSKLKSMSKKPKVEKKPLKEEKSFLQRIFRRKGGM
jgi:large subunit ribosomal protein L22